jgi:predicted alpha-1,2-mannosidase
MTENKKNVMYHLNLSHADTVFPGDFQNTENKRNYGWAARKPFADKITVIPDSPDGITYQNKLSAVLFFFFCIVVVLGYSQKKTATTGAFTQYVNPYIGTGGHGHVFLGANVPFGAVQAGPDNIFEGWDWCSGYNYSSNTITGFAQTHLSGTGIGDLGDVQLMPSNGKDDYLSTFSHQNETVHPGYYAVLLDKHKIKTEITASERVAFYKINYIKKDSAKMQHYLRKGIGWDSPVKTYLKKTGQHTIIGYRYSTGWADDQRLYFAITFQQDIAGIELYDSTAVISGEEGEGRQLRAVIRFSVKPGNPLFTKVGISPVSTDNALDNIQAEIPGWNFDGTVRQATDKWNRELGKVSINAGESTKTIFYTALYHTMIAPSLFNDANGDYSGTDKKIYRHAGFTNYTTFSLWDTYRAYHPLYTILHPERVSDIVNTFLNIYRQQGKLPVWHLMGNETNTMVGYHAVPVIVDAFLKGFRGFDTALAYEAVKQSAMQHTDGIQFIQRLQYIPADSVNESVAKALEYAVDDWCIAQMARALHHQGDYDYFLKRGKLYADYFDQQSHFMRGKLANGQWHVPFDPIVSRHREDDYTEGNAWQYTWLVPQDVEGLISLFGGDKPFADKLDSLFLVTGSMGSEASPDISGLIGQYAQGNEPNHHIPYLYSYAGQPYKTATLVRQITDTFYTVKADGLCGNEDLGQMSAWYVFSALGFYPVNPVNGAYVFGSPLINEAVIHIGGKAFHIKVINNSKNNKYIQRVILNGRPYVVSYLLHKDIVKGGTLVLYMGDQPSADWGIEKTSRPVSFVELVSSVEPN